MVLQVMDKSTAESFLFLHLDPEVGHHRHRHHHHQDENKVVPVNFSPEYSGEEDDNLSNNMKFLSLA